jgi:hypothetical protein
MSAVMKKSKVENVYKTFAKKYLERGMSPLPVRPGGRGAEVKGWPRYCDQLPSHLNRLLSK